MTTDDPDPSEQPDEQFGADHPYLQWIFSPEGTWIANPFYIGPLPKTGGKKPDNKKKQD